MTQISPSPFAYIVRSRHGKQYVQPSLDTCVAFLKEKECLPYTAIHENLVSAVFEGNREESADLSGYIESCEPDPSLVRELEESLDRVIEGCEKRWAERVAAKERGEKVFSVSGEQWFFRKDREVLLEGELVKHRVRWKS